MQGQRADKPQARRLPLCIHSNRLVSLTEDFISEEVDAWGQQMQKVCHMRPWSCLCWFARSVSIALPDKTEARMFHSNRFRRYCELLISRGSWLKFYDELFRLQPFSARFSRPSAHTYLRIFPNFLKHFRIFQYSVGYSPISTCTALVGSW